LKTTKFPPSYDIKVDLRKVNIGVLRTWIAAQVTALVGFEDDILVEFVFGMLESKDDPVRFCTHGCQGVDMADARSTKSSDLFDRVHER
jgi:hypothetical protein